MQNAGVRLKNCSFERESKNRGLQLQGCCVTIQSDAASAEKTEGEEQVYTCFVPFMQGIFIRHPEDVRQPHPHPWTGIAQDQRFNNRSWHLPQGAGQVLFLKRFACAGRVRSLVVSATALGVFRLYLNGVRLGEDEMSPGWTDYGSRVFVFSYDGTDAVQKENCLVAEVSAGWWSGRISFGAYGFRPVSFCGEITVQYEDGTAETYPTGEDWQCAFGGRVRFADIWDGERQDARMPEPSLNPGAYSFTGAVAMPDPLPVPCAPVGPQVKVRQQLTRSPEHAVYYAGTEENGAPLGKIRVSCERAGDGCEAGTLSPGTYLLLDFGQNMVGRPEITLRAPAGTTLEVRFAEMLNDTGDPSRGNDGPAGSPYLKNYRSAMALFTYTACGEGQECAVPGHVFYGFRYIEIACEQHILQPVRRCENPEKLMYGFLLIASGRKRCAAYRTCNEGAAKSVLDDIDSFLKRSV